MREKQKDNWRALNFRMNDEGLHYCFKHYSHWTEVEDDEFHRLRQNYLKSSEDLEEYIKNKMKQIYNNELEVD